MILSRCLPFRSKHSCKAVFMWLKTAKHISGGIPLISSRIFCFNLDTVLSIPTEK
ncbi:unnamed protein product, partial [Callosobruchus maculatus]